MVRYLALAALQGSHGTLEAHFGGVSGRVMCDTQRLPCTNFFVHCRVNHNVHLPESVSDHMFRMAVAALLLPADHGVDPVSASLIALCHDMPEAIVGDIPPQAPISAAEKHCLEAEAMASMVETLGDHPAGGHLRALWCVCVARMRFAVLSRVSPQVCSLDLGFDARSNGWLFRQTDPRMVCAVRDRRHAIGARCEGY